MKLPLLHSLAARPTGEHVQPPHKLGLYDWIDLHTEAREPDLLAVVQMDLRVAARVAVPIHEVQEPEAQRRVAKMMQGRIAHHVYAPVYDALLDLHRAMMDEGIAHGPVRDKLTAMLGTFGDTFRGEWSA